VSIDRFEVGDRVTVVGHDGVIDAIDRDLDMAHVRFDDEDFPDGWILPHVIILDQRRVLH
jgi:hypothetical protein